MFGYCLEYDSGLELLSNGKQIAPLEFVTLMTQEMAQVQQEKAPALLARSSLSLDDIVSIDVVKLQGAQPKPIDNKDFDLILNPVKQKESFLQRIWRSITGAIQYVKHLFGY